MSTRTRLLQQFQDSATELERELQAKSAEDFERREGPDAWSVREIVHHLADVEVGDAMRLRQMLAHDGPLIVAYDEELYASRLHYDRPVDVSLLVYSSLRASNVEIARRLSDADWSRRGFHEEHPLYSIEILVEHSIEHDRLHLTQIQRSLSVWARASSDE